jgi:hypothetical protein
MITNSKAVGRCDTVSTSSYAGRFTLAIKSMWDENSCQPWQASGSESKLIWLPGGFIVRGRPYFDIAR